jgi:hypothetical protein
MENRITVDFAGITLITPNYLQNLLQIHVTVFFNALCYFRVAH